VEAPWGENIETSRKYEYQIIRLGCPAAGYGGMYFICIFASKRTRPTPFSTELHLKALTTLPKSNYFASCRGKSERSALTFVKTRENMKTYVQILKIKLRKSPSPLRLVCVGAGEPMDFWSHDKSRNKKCHDRIGFEGLVR
jgi:hypothetical protein